jgi:hypothetical protein
VPELWPTLDGFDAAAGLRDRLRRLEASLPNEPTPLPATRGCPPPHVTSGALPEPPVPDCDVGLVPPRVPLRRGRVHGTRALPRARKPWTMLIPNLPGGVEMDGDDLLGGLMSLRRALGRGRTARHGVTTARRPPLVEPPSADALDALAGWIATPLADLASGPTLRLRYRSTEVKLPTAWVTAYLSRWVDTRGEIPAPRDTGPISGVGHVMDMFWPRFRARALGLRRGSYGRLIGCWGLPVTGDADLPQTLFFNGEGGALRAVHELTCQLLHAYVGEVKVPRNTAGGRRRKLVDDDGWCDQFGDFVEAILEGWPYPALNGEESVPVPRGEPPCGEVLIHYMDNQPRAVDEFFTNPCAAIGWGWKSEPIRCRDHSKGSNAWAGADLRFWNDYTIEVRTIPNLLNGRFRQPGVGPSYVHFSDADWPGNTSSPWPTSTGATTARGSSSERMIAFQPAHLAFDAELIDTLMFMGQLCLDYARHLLRGGLPIDRSRAAEANTAVQAGRRFAQYALAPLARRIQILIHELGHVYLGGAPHCGFHLDKPVPATRWRSCFDVASEAVYLRVAAENGLPMDPYIAKDVIGNSSILIADPDFSSRGADTGDMDRAFWVTDWAGGVRDCNAVQSGEEYLNVISRVATYARSPEGVCIGRIQATLTAPGAPNGGLEFATTNGCDCYTATPRVAVVPLSGDLPFEIDRSAACLTTYIGLRGVYFAATT